MKNKYKFSIVALVILLICMTGVIVFASSTSNSDKNYTYYNELYSPDDNVDISMSNSTYFNASVKDNNLTDSGKGLVLSYKIGYSNSLTVTIPTKETKCEIFEGLAFWVDVPLTTDQYSFTLYIENVQGDWQAMNPGSELTLIGEDGTITTVNSLWKRQQLNGFRGWVMLPKEAYTNSIPNSDGLYNFIFMIENEVEEGFYRTESMDITIGSIGYYNDYIGALYEFAGSDVLVKKINDTLDKYIAEANNLKPKNNEQTTLKNKMLVYFMNLRENFETLSTEEQLKIARELYDNYYSYMESYLYGEIRKTDYIMSFAIMSDTHFTQNWVNERFLSALEDAKTQKPELAAALVLGDISDNGVSMTDETHTELDNYYDWLDSYEYKNASGEDIPIINVLGNHDVRGHHKEGYPETSYQPAIDMYLEREDVDSIQFDKWINGYHFIFLNTDKYHSDDCYLSAETIEWLDETLSENEDGRPIFVMVHQPLGKVHTMSGAKMTFEEVIAKHPSAIVSSGHEHAAFGNAKIIQEGNGTHINQPAMVNVAAQYYIVEVYEGGVIYRAREASTNSWIIGSDVVVANEDMSNNIVFNSKNFDIDNLVNTNLTASIVSYDGVSGSALKIEGNENGGEAILSISSNGNNDKYAGYAFYIKTDTPLSLSLDGKSLKSGSIYYNVINGTLVENKIDVNGEIEGNGWIVIPKDSIDETVYPTKNTKLGIKVDEGQIVYLDQVSYYFNIEDFVENVSNLSYTFYNGDSTVLSKKVEYGSILVAPDSVTKEPTSKYTYQFVGWDIDDDGNVDELPDVIKGNIVAYAVYEATVRQYTYTLYANDGVTVLISKTADYGSKVDVPKISKLFGWDMDNDGAAENLPDIVTNDFTARAIIGEPEYNNAEVVYDASKNSNVSISTAAWSSGPSTISVNTFPINNVNSPSGKVAQFTHPGTQTAGTWIVKLNIPYEEQFENFQGYAIWVDIASTSEEYIGGFNISNVRPDKTNHSWSLIDINGNVTHMETKYTDYGMEWNLGKGFTGWIIVDKTSWKEVDQTKINPSSSTYLEFRFPGGMRTTSFTMNIGQVLAFCDKNAIIEELLISEKDFYEYSFTDENGCIYKAGQVRNNESIIIPDNPVHADKDMFFAGWDINQDGNPDELPTDGKLDENLKAVAVFCHVDAFESFHDGGKTGWKTDSNPNSLKITMTEENYLDAPTGKAVHFSINQNEVQDTGWIYALLNLPSTSTATGIAFWMDASTVDTFTFSLWKNWVNKSSIGDGGNYVYLFDENGSINTAGGWRQISVPANFKGWVVIPLNVFVNNSSIIEGDYLRLGFQFGEYNPNGFSADIYIGEAVTFNCTPQTFISQVNKRVYGFKDYDDTFISCEVLTDDYSIKLPKDPVREGWTFVGWDTNNDGIADNNIPDVLDERNFVAKAIYTKEFTYKFVDQNDNVILEKTLEYNSLILPPFAYGNNDPQYSYKITYIDYTEGMRLESDIILHVNLEKELKKYVIIFKDEDGNILQEEELEYGTLPSFDGEIPTKPSTEQYTYEFGGWNKEISNVTCNQEYVVVYNSKIIQYKVTFFDYDKKTILYEQMVDYGEVPVYEGNTPSRNSDGEYKYIFIGWDSELVSVTKDASYVAVYSKEPIDGHYHNFTNEWSKDDSKHWKECECGQYEDEGSHEYFVIVIKEATETEDGLIEYKCSYCGHSYTDAISNKKIVEEKVSKSGLFYALCGTVILSLGLSVGLFIIKKRKKSN